MSESCSYCGAPAAFVVTLSRPDDLVPQRLVCAEHLADAVAIYAALFPAIVDLVSSDTP